MLFVLQNKEGFFVLSSFDVFQIYYRIDLGCLEYYNTPYNIQEQNTMYLTLLDNTEK